MQRLNSAMASTFTTPDIQPQAQFPIIQGAKSLWAGLTILKSSLALLFGDTSLRTVGELTDGLLAMPAYDRLAQYLNQDPDCAALICDRYIPPTHDLDRLLTLPPDSLGYLYAAQMKKTGFDPNLHAGMKAETDAKYIELRLSQTHDLWHIVTGFDTSEAGEIGLQAFHLAQFPYPLGTLLVANSLISRTLMAPESLPELLTAIGQGFQMGKAAKPLFAQKWEEDWAKPLIHWQEELNIQPNRHP